MLVHGAQAILVLLVNIIFGSLVEASISVLSVVDGSTKATSSALTASPFAADTMGEVVGSSLATGNAVGTEEGTVVVGSSVVGGEDGPSVGDVLTG